MSEIFNTLSLSNEAHEELFMNDSHAYSMSLKTMQELGEVFTIDHPPSVYNEYKLSDFIKLITPYDRIKSGLNCYDKTLMKRTLSKLLTLLGDGVIQVYINDISSPLFIQYKQYVINFAEKTDDPDSAIYEIIDRSAP
jgi:hypothetical protein